MGNQLVYKKPFVFNQRAIIITLYLSFKSVKNSILDKRTMAVLHEVKKVYRVCQIARTLETITCTKARVISK